MPAGFSTSFKKILLFHFWMELKVLSEDNEKIEIEIAGENHTFCNILRKELWKDKSTALASYNIKHPLVSNPVFIVQTESGKPRKVLKDTVASIKAKAKELRALVKKL